MAGAGAGAGGWGWGWWLGLGLGLDRWCSAQPAHLVSPGALARKVCDEPLAWCAGALVPANDHAARTGERMRIHRADV